MISAGYGIQMMKANKWHYVAGGGFYYNPFNLVILSATVGYSKEERVFNFSLGSKFNLHFRKNFGGCPDDKDELKLINNGSKDITHEKLTFYIMFK